MSVVTRFPPSPTGYLHVGGARTALYNWLYARQQGGRMILRIEDTDRERSTPESVQAILDGMAWLGLDYDEGPHYQTARFPRYREVVAQMLDAGTAYRCYCSREEVDAMREEQRAAGLKPRYDGRCRERTKPVPGVNPVIRFRNPLDGAVQWDDLVKGPISISNTELDDLIIARSDGTPTYNLTVVVDDMDMAISHVVRGDDHVNNTPRQINILAALGAPLPVYAHVPMILGSDGARLSKRHGAVSVMQYREQGFLPVALRNYLVRLGWSHGDQEIFSTQEMLAAFDVKQVHKAAARFDTDKLLWLNHHYIQEADPADLAEELAWQFARLAIDAGAGPALADVVVALRERSRTLVEMAEKARFWFEAPTAYAEKDAAKHFGAATAEILADLRGRLAVLDEWVGEALHDLIKQVAETHAVGMGKVAQPVRVAIAGVAASPSIDVTLELLGREQTLARLDAALEYLRK